MIRKSVLFSALAVVSACVAFATPDKDKTKKPVEIMTCPVTYEAVVGKGGGAVKVDNYNLHFCCEGCSAKFAKLSKAEKAKHVVGAVAADKKNSAKKSVKTAAAPEAKPTPGVKLVKVNTCPVTGEEIKGAGGGKSIYGKYEVNFCCAGCKPEFDGKSDADKEKLIAAVVKK